jgi:hypothetical protein
MQLTPMKILSHRFGAEFNTFDKFFIPYYFKELDLP